ncbi:MAG: FAD/NAD(P)-binding protein [bacterium]|nr:FAD/NAD(P)-binding protein [bacterium]MDT8395052.1 FAD/NAD(P)-binding protein [bacterium]
MNNLYLTADWTILEIREIIPGHFFVSLSPSGGGGVPEYSPGQFFQISVHGIGEAPVSVSSSPTRPGTLEMCIRKVGRLTAAIAGLRAGNRVGIRGPFGNGFPLERMRGNDLVLLAGGLGIVPLRSLVNYAVDLPGEFGQVTVLYGAGTDAQLLFIDDLLGLSRDINIQLIVQEITGAGPYEERFGDRTGFVTDLIPGSVTRPTRTFAAMCGPPVFYRYAVSALLAEGLSKRLVYMSLERRMECGIGKCGHCGVGYRYTCVDGPIFNYWDAFNMPELIEMREGEPWIS